MAGDKNEITLKNGRKIKYDNLVIAIGQVPAWDKIKGFDEAWLDDYHPLYTS